MRVEFRAAGVDDIDLLVELRLEYIRDDLAPLDAAGAAVIEAQLRNWLPANLGERVFAQLALVDQVPAAVAMLAVTEYPANPGRPNGRAGTILNVWTRPAFRHRGLATDLLRQVITLGASLELSRLDLRASQTARPLYERLGFVPADDRHVAMQRPYASGPVPEKRASASAHQQ